MESHEIVKASLKRTLSLAQNAAIHGDIKGSQHHGKQCRSILLDLYGNMQGIPPCDFERNPPLKSARVRRFYKKRLRSLVTESQHKAENRIELYDVAQLFCPKCAVFLIAEHTLEIIVNHSMLEPDSPTKNSDKIEGKKEVQFSNPPIKHSKDCIIFVCGACRCVLPSHQLRPS